MKPDRELAQFSRLVEAVRPWFGQIIFVGGWAHRLYRVRPESASLMYDPLRTDDAHRRGDVRATIGRASDFYGPGGTLTQLGDYFWPRVLKRRGGQVLANPDAIHTYHYIPDVAAGIARLGTAPDEVLGKPWMLPCRPAENLRDLVRRLEKPLGAPIALTVVPGWMRALLSLFIPTLREMPEMQYQWEEPFVIDDRPFREFFGVQPDDADLAAAATVTWARSHYARA